MINNWVLMLRTVMLMTPFRWVAYLFWEAWNGFHDFWVRCRGTPVWKEVVFFFPASKVTSFSLSCELSLQISNCGIFSLGGIVCCCWECCCCCCCCWKEAFTASMFACTFGHLFCHCLKKTYCGIFGFVI